MLAKLTSRRPEGSPDDSDKFVIGAGYLIHDLGLPAHGVCTGGVRRNAV